MEIIFIGMIAVVLGFFGLMLMLIMVGQIFSAAAEILSFGTKHRGRVDKE